MTFSKCTCAAIGCVFVAFVSGGIIAGEPVRTEVLSDTAERTVVRFTFEDYGSRSVTIGGRSFLELWIPGEAIHLEKGAPAVPHASRSLIVPDDAEMALEVLETTYQEIPAAIAPSKGNLLRSVRPEDVPYEFGTAYTEDAFYPGPLAVLHEPYILRDHRGVTVQVNPFQYNPVKGTLRVYSEISIEVKRIGAGKMNILDRPSMLRGRSGAFRDIYRAHFLNYGAHDFRGKIDEEGGMLVICHDEWLPNMAPFVEHKAAVGISVTLAGVSTIGNDAASIKSYIQDAYDSGTLAYVLLVGDSQQVPSFTVSGGASDPSYSKLAGDDDYPEVIVGRFSAASAAQLDTQVSRTIAYETLPATQQEWFWRGTTIASDEGAGIGDEGQSDIEHEAQIRDWLLDAGYTEVDQIYDPGAGAWQVKSAIETGRGIVNYTGHGSAVSWGTTGFGNSDVNALENTGMLPFLFSVACVNGNFDDYGTCFAEAWLRATHDGEPTGAVAAYMSSINQSWAPPMEAQDEFNLLLTDPAEPYRALGALCYAGSSSMMDAYGSDGAEMFDTWIYFGDPSLRVIGIPIARGMLVAPWAGLASQGQAGGPMAPDTREFTLTNLDEVAVSYEVTASQPWISLSNASGTIPVGATAIVQATLGDLARNLDNGKYMAALNFVNLTNHYGDASRTVSLTVGLPHPLENWTLDTGPGWTTEGQWCYCRPFGLGGTFMGHPDPVSAFTGTNVYGVALKGDYVTTVGGPYYLTTGPVDLSGGHNTTLRFRRWLNTQGLPYATARIEILDRDDVWNPVWTNGSASVMDDEWVSREYDISDVADGVDGVQLRWSYSVESGAATPCSGWNLDDVEIWGTAQTARITLTVTPLSLEWTPVQDAESYDVVHGDLAALRASAGDFSVATSACLPPVVGTSVELAESPPTGSGWWILVRGVSGSGPLTFESLSSSQVDLRDAEITAACP